MLALAILFALCACGQKGPLYLPGNPSEIKTEVPKHDAESADKKDEKKDDKKDSDNPPE
jgi:predicted small lipoprotein YifL